MRRITALTISLLLLILAGCGGAKTENKPAAAEPAKPAAPAAQTPAASAAPKAPTQPVPMNVATATTGGAYYPIGNAIAKLWNDKIPTWVKASAQATNGTPHNIQLLGKKDAEVGFAQSGVVFQAVNGSDAYKDQGKQTHFKGMTHLYPNVMHWVVRKDSNIKGLADLKGKKIVPGAQNSATELNSREMLAILNMDYRTKGDLKADYLDYNQAADQLKNRQTDGIMIAGGVPTAAVLDVMTAGEGKLLSLPADYIKELTTKYPWYFPITIPKGAYKGQDEDIKTVAVANMLIARNDLSEDVVYQLVKAMYDNITELQAAHGAMKAFKLEDALKGITGVVDLHPGAAKFYKEKGILK